MLFTRFLPFQALLVSFSPKNVTLKTDVTAA